jgi:hypothetical protein
MGGDISFDEGRFIPISFANWDGSNGEAGLKHTLTTWYWLILPPQINLTYVIGIPLLMTILSIMGLIAVRSQRKLSKSQHV